VLAVGYIGFEKYSLWKGQRDVSIYQQGVDYGSAVTIAQIMQQASTCQPVPLYIGNSSMDIVGVWC